MHGLFGPLDQINLADVRAFLDDAGEEGVTWEAKADDDEQRAQAAGQEPGRLGKGAIRKAVCGMANQIGGYLIIGARGDKKTSTWSLPGVVIEHPEAETYLRDVIDGGLQPVPRYDVKAWRLDDGHVVALVEIEPVAQPPCMTNLGHVYERASGETRKVNDPKQLDVLFRRGRQAVKDAEAIAERAAETAMGSADDDDRAVGISVAVAPIAHEPDISSRLFAQSFDQIIRGACSRFLGATKALYEIDGPNTTMSQDRVAAVASESEPDEPQDRWLGTWVVEASWDGAACAHVSLSRDRTVVLSAIDQVVTPGWRECVELVRRIGGYGPARLAVLVRLGDPDYGHMKIELPGSYRARPAKGSFFDKFEFDTVTLITRAIELQPPTEKEVGSLHRELQRAAGVTSFEPEPGVVDDEVRHGTRESPKR